MGWDFPVDPSVGVRASHPRAAAAAELDGKAFFQTMSAVDDALRADPAGVYMRIDFETRDTFGYYLVGPGRTTPEEQIGYRRKGVERFRRWVLNNPVLAYLGLIFGMTLAMGAGILGLLGRALGAGATAVNARGRASSPGTG